MQVLDGLAQGDQALHIVHGTRLLDRAVPVDGVHRVAGVVAVAIAALGAQELLAELHVGDALREQNQRVGELGASESRLLGVVGRALDQLVVQGQVVVDLDVLHHLIRAAVVRVGGAVVAVAVLIDALALVVATEHVGGDEVLLVGLAGDEAGVLVGEHAALDRVAQGVVEERHALDLGGIGLRGFLVANGVSHIPAFADDENRRIDLVKRRTHLIHGGLVNQTHEVEAEAVHVVLGRPVLHGIDDVLAGHRTLGSHVVAAAGAVGQVAIGVVAEVVARHGLVEGVFGGVVDVVVDHIHHHVQAVLVQPGDHLLHFLDASARVTRVGGVRAFRHVVVLRIVAPVVLRAVAQIAGLVHGTVVVDGHDLHMRHAERLEVVDAGGRRALLAVDRGALLDEAEILAAIGFGDAGVRVDGHVTNVRLGDDRVGRLAERRHALAGIALLLVGEHDGSLAVGHGGGRVRVGGRVDRAVGEGQLVVVGVILEIFVHGERPHALLAGLLQRHGVGLRCLRIGGVGVQAQRHLGGGRRPQLERGLLGLVGHAKIIAVVGVLLVERVGAHDGAERYVLRAVVLDRHLVGLGHVKIVGRGNGHGVPASLHVLDLHTLDRHRVGRLVDGERLVELDRDGVEVGHFGGDDRALRVVERAVGVDCRVALHQPDFGGCGAVGVHGDGGLRDRAVLVVRILGFPAVAAVAHDELRSAHAAALERVLGDQAVVVVLGERVGSTVDAIGPAPDAPCLHAVFAGVVVGEAVVVDGHVDLVGGLLVAVGGFGERFVRIGAVDPDFGGAGGTVDGTVAADLVPAFGGDDHTDLGGVVRTIDGGLEHLAVGVLAGEGVPRAVQGGAVLVGAPHVHAAIGDGVAFGGLVVHDHLGLGLVRLHVGGHAGAGLVVGDRRPVALRGVVAAAIRVVPVVAAVGEYVFEGLALRIDRELDPAVAGVGHQLVALLGPAVDTVVEVRLLPAVGQLVVDGAARVGRGLLGLVVDGQVRIGRIGLGRAGPGILGRARVDRDGGVLRERRVERAVVLHGHSCRAVAGGVHVAVFAGGQ